MNKPILCQILDVEVGENFQIKGYEHVDLAIMKDGTLISTGPLISNEIYSTLLKTLDHPENIIKTGKPIITFEKVTLNRKQRAEGINRLKILGAPQFNINMLGNHNTPCISYITPYAPILFKNTNLDAMRTPEIYKQIQDFEHEYKSVVYCGIHQKTDLGEWLYLLFVSQDENQWEENQLSLNELNNSGKATMIAYVITSKYPGYFCEIALKRTPDGIIKIR